MWSYSEMRVRFCLRTCDALCCSLMTELASGRSLRSHTLASPPGTSEAIVVSLWERLCGFVRTKGLQQRSAGVHRENTQCSGVSRLCMFLTRLWAVQLWVIVWYLSAVGFILYAVVSEYVLIFCGGKNVIIFSLSRSSRRCARCARTPSLRPPCSNTCFHNLL